MATTLLRRALSTVTDRRTLWVCYADTGTVRRRLASLAQQVRRALDDEYLPQLVLPRGEREYRSVARGPPPRTATARRSACWRPSVSVLRR